MHVIDIICLSCWFVFPTVVNHILFQCLMWVCWKHCSVVSIPCNIPRLSSDDSHPVTDWGIVSRQISRRMVHLFGQPDTTFEVLLGSQHQHAEILIWSNIHILILIVMYHICFDIISEGGQKPSSSGSCMGSSFGGWTGGGEHLSQLYSLNRSDQLEAVNN